MHALYHESRMGFHVFATHAPEGEGVHSVQPDRRPKNPRSSGAVRRVIRSLRSHEVRCCKTKDVSDDRAQSLDSGRSIKSPMLHSSVIYTPGRPTSKASSITSKSSQCRRTSVPSSLRVASLSTSPCPRPAARRWCRPPCLGSPGSPPGGPHTTAGFGQKPASKGEEHQEQLQAADVTGRGRRSTLDVCIYIYIYIYIYI